MACISAQSACLPVITTAAGFCRFRQPESEFTSFCEAKTAADKHKTHETRPRRLFPPD